MRPANLSRCRRSPRRRAGEVVNSAHRDQTLSAADELADPLGLLLEVAANRAHLALQAAGPLADRSLEPRPDCSLEPRPAIAQIALDPRPGLTHLILDTRTGGGTAPLVAPELAAKSGGIPVPARKDLDGRDQAVARGQTSSDLDEERSRGQVLYLGDRSQRLGRVGTARARA